MLQDSYVLRGKDIHADVTGLKLSPLTEVVGNIPTF